MIVAHQHFIWFVSALVFATAVYWFVLDTVRLRRALPLGKEAHDRIFGSIIGLAMSIAGMTGVLLYHWG